MIIFFGLFSIFSASEILSWSDFKTTFQKNYSASEDQHRLEIYANYIEKLEAHNVKFESGEISYEIGINRFSDWTETEQKAYLNRNGLRGDPKLGMSFEYLFSFQRLRFLQNSRQKFKS